MIFGLVVGRLLGGGVLPAVVAAAVALAAAAGAYLSSDRVALAMNGAQPADPDEYPRYHNLVEGLCVAAGLPKPDLYIVVDDAPNAFTVGRNPEHAAVAVTTGLLDKLSRVELEAVLAHELSHIRNHDILVTTIAVTLVGLPALVLGPVSAKIMRLALGRGRESVADVTGVRLTRYPPGLIHALEKVRSDSAAVRSASRATAHLWLESPVGREDPTHPPLEERIKTLRDL